MIATFHAGTRISRKIRESTAKDPRKGRERCNGPSPPVPLQSLYALRPHFCGENPMFPFFFFPVLLLIFRSSSSGGRMRCVKRWWANTLPIHANARLNLSHVTTGFLLSPRKVRERGCCSMDCAKATAVTAKVKQKDSRKTVRVRILVFFTAQMCWGCRSYRRGSLEKGHLGRAARRRSIRYQKNSEKVQ